MLHPPTFLPVAAPWLDTIGLAVFAASGALAAANGRRRGAGGLRRWQIAADKAGVIVTDRGFINVDSQMRTNVPNIFAIGDLVGQPMLAHKAVHEGHVAAEAAAGQKSHFDVKVIPSVAYTDPEVAWAGITEDEAKAKGIKVEKGHFPWAASGRAVANGRAEGFTKLLFDAETHRIIGGTISANGSNSASDRKSIQNEVSALSKELDRVATSTQFNGQNVLDGSLTSTQFQVG
eukprot:gene38499-43613_t